jgi:hypothetical protein
MKKTTHPEWALAHKRKGTELRLLNGRYYLYEATSKWSPDKKRSVKVTGKLLGKITEADGFIESDKARLRKQQIQIGRVQVKEYGIASAMGSLLAGTISALREFYPGDWQRIAALAYGRLVYASPLKNMSFHYSNSYLSEQYSNIDLSAKSAGYFLRGLGRDRERIVEFCKSFKITDDCILFDGTDIFSRSERMELPKFSRSKLGSYDDMVNLMCIFSVRQQAPAYYRILPGSIKDVSAFRLSLEESGVKNATVVMDKGFASEANMKALEKAGLKFIIPLRRDSRLINYNVIKSGRKSLFDGYFKYEGRYIWHYAAGAKKQKSGRRITVFLDEELRGREQKDYLNRIESKVLDYTIEKFHDKEYKTGTIAIIDNTGKRAEQVYADYKTRGEVETMIDSLKNIVDADRTYMQNELALEGWMFINLIALKWYYIILNLLKKHELNRKYSPRDFLLFLAEIKKVRINNEWHSAEVTQKTQDIMDMLGVPIT